MSQHPSAYYTGPSTSRTDGDKKAIPPRKSKGDSEHAAQPKKRVKTGCLTCRKRRIKCIPAEESPVCVNCAKTNRVCIPAPPVVPANAKRRPIAKRTKSDGSVPLPDADRSVDGQPTSSYDYTYAQQPPDEYLQPLAQQADNIHGYGLPLGMAHPVDGSLLAPSYFPIPADSFQPPPDPNYPFYSPGIQSEVEVTDSYPFVQSNYTTDAGYGMEPVGDFIEHQTSYSTHSASISTPGPSAATLPMALPNSLPLSVDNIPGLSYSNQIRLADEPPQEGNVEMPVIMDHTMQQLYVHQQVQAQQQQQKQQKEPMRNSHPLQAPLQPNLQPANAMRHFSGSNSSKSSPGNMHSFLSNNTGYIDNDYGTALEWRSPPPAQLDPMQQFFMNQFMSNPPLGFGALEEGFAKSVLPNAAPALSIRESNFWSFVIPSMAIKCPALLHSLLALSAVREANLQSDSDCENRALLDYHQAVRKLSKAIKLPGSSMRDELLAATLVLAYYETASGETMRWGRHLEGSVFLVRQRIASTYNINKNAQFQFVAVPTIAEHLIWFHIHQDTIQSLLSGTGLYLELQYMEAMPLRGKPGSVMHSTDQLRVLMARVGDFVGRDRKRKAAQQADDTALKQAFNEWNQLLSAFNAWKKALSADFDSRVLPGALTPFGEVLVFQHPAIATLATLHLACMITLHRNRPDLSLVPAEASKVVMMTTFPLCQLTLRMLSGIMMDAMENTQVEQTSHSKSMINSVMPAFLAGTCLQDPDQRNYLDSMLKDIFKLTGWRTALRVCQGLDVAWGRVARGFHGLLNTVDADPKLAREKPSRKPESPGSERSSVLQDGKVTIGGGAPESRFVLLDKSQALNAVVGVLGRLELVDELVAGTQAGWPAQKTKFEGMQGNAVQQQYRSPGYS